VPFPARRDDKAVRHVTHAADSAAESVPEEPFEALLARLGVEYLEQATVKKLSDVCAKLGVAKTGEHLHWVQ